MVTNVTLLNHVLTKIVIFINNLENVTILTNIKIIVLRFIHVMDKNVFLMVIHIIIYYQKYMQNKIKINYYEKVLYPDDI